MIVRMDCCCCCCCSLGVVLVVEIPAADVVVVAGKNSDRQHRAETNRHSSRSLLWLLLPWLCDSCCWHKSWYLVEWAVVVRVVATNKEPGPPSRRLD